MKLAIIVTAKRRFSPPSSRTRAASAIPPSNMIQRSIGQRWRSTTLPYLSLRGAGQAAEFVGWIVLARRLGTTAFGELARAGFLAVVLQVGEHDDIGIPGQFGDCGDRAGNGVLAVHFAVEEAAKVRPDFLHRDRLVAADA